MTSYGDMKTVKRNVLLIPNFCLYLQKDFLQDFGHSLDLGQRQSGTPLSKKDLEENGTHEHESYAPAAPLSPSSKQVCVWHV